MILKFINTIFFVIFLYLGLVAQQKNKLHLDVLYDRTFIGNSIQLLVNGYTGAC